MAREPIIRTRYVRVGTDLLIEAVSDGRAIRVPYIDDGTVDPHRRGADALAADAGLGPVETDAYASLDLSEPAPGTGRWVDWFPTD